MIGKTILCTQIMLTSLCQSPKTTTKRNCSYFIITMRIRYLEFIQPIQILTTYVQRLFKLPFFEILFVPEKFQKEIVLRIENPMCFDINTTHKTKNYTFLLQRNVALSNAYCNRNRFISPIECFLFDIS